MASWFTKSVMVTLGVGASGTPILGPAIVRAQVVRERDVTVTGPRGNSLTRDLKSVRGPGFVERETTIHRPGGATFQSDTILRRGGGQHFGPGPGFGGPRGVIVNNYGGRGLSAGNALLDFGLGAVVGGAVGGLVGRATAPPPIVVGPPVLLQQPIVIAQPPPIVVQSPPRYIVAAPQPVSVVPPEVASALARLASRHDNSRRDGCLILGRLGDDRAVPALMDRLKNDPAPPVRIAAASALGMIGDPNTAQILERSVVYDKRQEVRDASAVALQRVRSTRSAVIPSSEPTLESVESYPVTRSQPVEIVPPPPTPAISGR